MTTQPHPRYVILLSALLAWPMASPGSASADADPDARVPGAATFDALFEQFAYRGEQMPSTDAEVLAALRRLRAVLPPGDAARAARLEALDCQNLTANETYPQALAIAEAGLARPLARQDPQVRMEYLLCKAFIKYSMGHVDAYTAALRQVRDLASAERYPRLHSGALWMLSFAEIDTGLYANALRLQRDVLRMDQQRHAVGPAMGATLGIANSFRRIGLPSRAVALIQQVRSVARSRGDADVELTALRALAELERDAGRSAQALARYAEARNLVTRLGQDDVHAHVLLQMAGLLAERGQLGEARALRVQVESLLSPKGAPTMFAGSRAQVDALIALRSGDAVQAEGLAESALRRFRESNDLRAQLDALDLRAQAERLQGEWRAALDTREEQMQLRQQLDARVQREQASFLVAEFEDSQRALDNLRLQRKADLQQRKLEEVERGQRLRNILLGSLFALIAALAILQLRTWLRLRSARNEASTDALTGAASRRKILAVLSNALQHSRTHGNPVSVVALDIDHFKPINDQYGHAAGDLVLQRVSAICREHLRATDDFGRIGGEEFLALLPATGTLDAARLAERLRAAVADLRLHPPLQDVRVSISLGVATACGTDSDTEALLARADAALYAAKRHGRDRVEVGH